MKGDSSSAIFILLVIALFVGASLVIFYGWIKINQGEISKTKCVAAQQNYCMALINNQNPTWDIKDPSCTKPSDEECKRMFGKD